MNIQIINRNNTSIKKIITKFSINYIKYYFLTVSVMFSIAVLFFIVININPDYSFNFIQYFSFIIPFDNMGHMYMETPEIMKIFSVIAFVWMIIASLIKIALRKIFEITISFSLKLKMHSLFAITSLSYIFASFLVALNNLDKGFYFMLIFFYIINIVSIIGYFNFEKHLIELNKNNPN